MIPSHNHANGFRQSAAIVIAVSCTTSFYCRGSIGMGPADADVGISMMLPRMFNPNNCVFGLDLLSNNTGGGGGKSRTDGAEEGSPCWEQDEDDPAGNQDANDPKQKFKEEENAEENNAQKSKSNNEERKSNERIEIPQAEVQGNGRQFPQLLGLRQTLAQGNPNINGGLFNQKLQNDNALYNHRRENQIVQTPRVVREFHTRDAVMTIFQFSSLEDVLGWHAACRLWKEKYNPEVLKKFLRGQVRSKNLRPENHTVYLFRTLAVQGANGHFIGTQERRLIVGNKSSVAPIVQNPQHKVARRRWDHPWRQLPVPTKFGTSGLFLNNQLAYAQQKVRGTVSVYDAMLRGSQHSGARLLPDLRKIVYEGQNRLRVLLAKFSIQGVRESLDQSTEWQQHLLTDAKKNGFHPLAASLPVDRDLWRPPGSGKVYNLSREEKNNLFKVRSTLFLPMTLDQEWQELAGPLNPDNPENAKSISIRKKLGSFPPSVFLELQQWFPHNTLARRVRTVLLVRVEDEAITFTVGDLPNEQVAVKRFRETRRWLAY